MIITATTPQQAVENYQVKMASNCATRSSTPIKFIPMRNVPRDFFLKRIILPFISIRLVFLSVATSTSNPD
jgi:hypothetical protein